jgi:hypothetical protein
VTAPRVANLVAVAVLLAAIQSRLVEQLDSPIFRHLDIPLATVVALIVLRPSEAVVTGFVFGLAVDGFQLQLFGLHALAYTGLGPVAALVPVNALRSRTEVVASLAAVQSQVAILTVVAGGWLLDGRFLPGLFGRLVQGGMWTVVIVVPLVAVLGGRTGTSFAEHADRQPAPTSADWP